MKRIIAVVIAFSMLSSSVAYGHTIDLRKMVLIPESNWRNPGWRFVEDSNGNILFLHAKKKVYTFRYSSAIVRTEYDRDFKAGIALWGEQIIMTEKGGAPNVVTQGVTSDNRWTAEAQIPLVKGQQHIAGWTIRVNTHRNARVDFDSLSATLKRNVMAHEIGHVYGLSDLRTDSHRGKLMYSTDAYLADSPRTLAQGERLGMDVMTRAHKKHAKKDTATGQCVSTYGNAKQHGHLCSCGGVYVLEKHNYKNGSIRLYESTDPRRTTHHRILCVGCGGGNQEKKHKFDKVTNRCACGLTK